MSWEQRSAWWASKGRVACWLQCHAFLKQAYGLEQHTVLTWSRSTTVPPRLPYRALYALSLVVVSEEAFGVLLHVVHVRWRGHCPCSLAL